ncbi:MAG: endo alpha-1,4 polygalactosaminidase, partial [Proteobacteria bacterium]|nr:endo alpha-1,4 polygalactosaminidase [Pseudomonadota bacterium]
MAAAILTGLLAGFLPSAGWGQSVAPAASATLTEARRPGLGSIKSWGYQLQHTDITRVAASPYDLVVVDYSRNGKEASRFSRADVERMRTRPDGTKRRVLAYLSIGEAEDYRYYWREAWVESLTVLDGAGGLAKPTDTETPATGKSLRVPRLGAPTWLGRENEAWPGNFFVRYWDPQWQGLIFRDPGSYLSRIVEAGFDGVYLDRIDMYQHASGEGFDAKGPMVRFVVELAAAARALKPGFLVVPQNGEQLLADPGYLAAIDAVAKEDLLFGEESDGEPNPPEAIARSMRWLAPARLNGVPVLVVEYLDEPAQVERARAEIEKSGFVPYFGVRALDALPWP